MATSFFIAAIEFGSTKITGIAGTKNPDGSIDVLAYAAEKSIDCIKRGIIYNIDKTTQCVSRIIKHLEDELGSPIKKVYVGIGGMSVRTVNNTVVRKLPEDTKISQALIDEMMKENKEMILPDREILAVASPQEYKIGNTQITTEPVGIPTDRIEGHYLNIIARNSVKSNICKCFQQTGYEIADFILSPMATADAVLAPSEKRSGCVLVDCGADTTTVSVYKSNALKYLAVIPLGGNNITKDIASQRVEEDDAEQMKLRFGKACISADDNKDDYSKEYNLDGRYAIRANDFNNIVTFRQKEIIENVWNQVKLSEYGDKLMAGIILTGGAALMPNMDKAFTAVTQIEQVRVAQNSSMELRYAPTALRDGTHNTLIGLLSAGKENCRKIDQQELQADMFKQQEEEEKRKAIEAARIAAEEKARKDAAEAARVKAEKEAQQKSDRYVSLLKEVRQLTDKKKFKDALKKLSEAEALGFSDKQGEIDDERAKIQKLKKENNPLSKWLDIIGKEVDDLTND